MPVGNLLDLIKRFKMNKSMSDKRRRLSWISLLMATLLLFGQAQAALAQRPKVDLNALTRETQKTIQKAGKVTIVWWIPEEFWQASFAENPTITETQTEVIVQALRPYTLIAVVDGTIGPFGGMQYRPKADIQVSIQLRDSQGIRYSPLREDMVNVDTKNFLSMMKPALTNMLGPMGQNMHFFLFPAKNKQGQGIAQAKSKGDFAVELEEREFRWRLPLSSLLPSKICPRCAEISDGAWNFCPWCGTKLSE